MQTDVRRCQMSISALPAISLRNLIIVSVITSGDRRGFLPCPSLIVCADGLKWTRFEAMMQLFLVESTHCSSQTIMIATRGSAYAVAQRSTLLGRNAAGTLWIFRSVSIFVRVLILLNLVREYLSKDANFNICSH